MKDGTGWNVKRDSRKVEFISERERWKGLSENRHVKQAAERSRLEIVT
jgi:hypothetical protein